MRERRRRRKEAGSGGREGGREGGKERGLVSVKEGGRVDVDVIIDLNDGLTPRGRRGGGGGEGGKLG